MNDRSANRRLLQAVLDPRRPKALRSMTEACADGADPNGYCDDGSTLLTHSVHSEASRAVEKLLELGADANMQDRNGWTPWAASLLTDRASAKRETIQALLLQYGAQPSGEAMARAFIAAYDGDVETLASLLRADTDLRPLRTYRIDLLDHARRQRNHAVLELLLQHAMKPRPHDLTMAIKGRDLEAVDLFLRYGADPNGEHNETPLMHAAADGNLVTAQRLVAAGADVNRFSFDHIEWTAEFYARRAGYTELADWLRAQMDVAILTRQQTIQASRNPKFAVLYEQVTCGRQSRGEVLTTDDIAAKLEIWDERYGISLTDVHPDAMTVCFDSLPADLSAFCDEVRQFCPDVCDGLETMGELEAEEAPESLGRGDPNHQAAAFAEALKRNKVLMLWWD